jgi:hypothetical protein
MGRAIGIIGVGFVRRHVEGSLGVVGIAADRRQPLCRERMIELTKDGCILGSVQWRYRSLRRLQAA